MRYIFKSIMRSCVKLEPWMPGNEMRSLITSVDFLMRKTCDISATLWLFYRFTTHANYSRMGERKENIISATNITRKPAIHSAASVTARSGIRNPDKPLPLLPVAMLCRPLHVIIFFDVGGPEVAVLSVSLVLTPETITRPWSTWLRLS